MCRSIEGWRNFSCLVCRPDTLARHRLKEDRFRPLRIIVITSPSLRPKRRFIASKGVRSSHAISMMRFTSNVFLLTSGFCVLTTVVLDFLAFKDFYTNGNNRLKVLKLKICEYIQRFNFLTSRALFMRKIYEDLIF